MDTWLRLPARNASALCVVVALLVTLVPAAPGSAQTGDLPPGGTFWDDDGSAHEGMIEAIVSEGITAGCTADGRNYCPSATVTRGQMASFLARALDLPPTDVDFFSDDDGDTHEENINRVAAAGIASGRTDGTFGASDPVTRAQMATFLANALDLPSYDGVARFEDVSGSHAGNIGRVAAAEITVGCNPEGTRFCPSTDVSRGQMASFLGRALELEANVPPPRALTEGVLTVRRYMDETVDRRYAAARNLSIGVARDYIDYVVKFTEIDGAFDRTTYSITTSNSQARSLGDRRWRLNMVLRWNIDVGQTVELSDFVVVQRADGTFLVESYHRDGLPMSAYVRTGNIAQSQGGAVTGRLVAQFRRADMSRPTLVNIVAVTNNRRQQISVDDWMAWYTTRSDNETYNAFMGNFPTARPGQTVEFILFADEVRAPHSSADLGFMTYGPDPSGFEFEQIVGMRVPGWPR